MLDNCGLSGTSIEGHAWSPMIIAGQNNKREVAVCDGDGMIKIFSQNDGKWTLVANLKGHDQAVTGIDWARSACGSIDRIISVSADRNGYVWSRSGDDWKKTLVHLRFKRAATCVRWSPDGESFAVGGSEGIVAIGSYDASDDWWVCHHVRNKINPSPILSLSWHPSSTAIAISCLSGAIHLISADGSKTLKGWEQFLANNSNLDDQETSDHLKPEALRPSSAKTDVLSSTRMGCWIHSLSWSPSGLVLAAAAHAGTVFILEPNEIISVDLCKGPLRSVLLIDDSKISACGFSSLNSTPMVISKSSGQWKLDKVASLINSFDNENEKQVGSVFKGAFAKFKALDLSGSSESQFPAKSKDACAHAKGVSSMCLLPNEKLQFSTCGLDGRILVWTL